VAYARIADCIAMSAKHGNISFRYTLLKTERQGTAKIDVWSPDKALTDRHRVTGTREQRLAIAIASIILIKVSKKR
jgi:hypothetical protein